MFIGTRRGFKRGGASMLGQSRAMVGVGRGRILSLISSFDRWIGGGLYFDGMYGVV